jgi:hypothetical protein
MRNFDISITGDYIDANGNQFRIVFIPNPEEPPTVEELTGVANALANTRVAIMEIIMNIKKESITLSDEIKKLTEPGETSGKKQ